MRLHVLASGMHVPGRSGNRGEYKCTPEHLIILGRQTASFLVSVLAGSRRDLMRRAGVNATLMRWPLAGGWVWVVDVRIVVEFMALGSLNSVRCEG